MNRQVNNGASSWEGLSRMLGGSFTARARGLLEPEIVFLNRTGTPFGRLELRGNEGATLTAGDAEAEIRRTNISHQEMTSGGTLLLTSHTRSQAIKTADQAYKVQLSLLRNNATARIPGGQTAARISGGLSNRRYRATFDPENADALPIALFLLYRLNTLRSRAYRALR